MTTYTRRRTAALFVDCASVDELAVVAVRRDTEVPVLVVGRGSDMLVADEGFAGIAVSISEMACRSICGPSSS